MISRIIFKKNLSTSISPSQNQQSPRQPYIVSATSRPLLRRDPGSTPRHSVIHKRVHRGLRLVSSPPPATPKQSTVWRFLNQWLEQKHLDRGFLFLAASSALLLLLSSR